MTNERAKEILLTYRPGTDDAQDEETTEALDHCRSHPELQEWLAGQLAWHEVVRAKLKAITAPEGLAQQILSERPNSKTGALVNRRTVVGALAVVATLMALGSIVWTQWPSWREDQSFGAYRQRMIRTALRAYGMDLETNNLSEVRTFLAGKSAPSDFELTAALASTELVGCGLMRWQGRPVTMVCFRTGKPLEPGNKSDLFLFVIANKDLKQGACLDGQEFARVSELTTASWQLADKTYILAGFDDSEVRQRL